MTDRDALIERVTKEADHSDAHNIRFGCVPVADLRALISLASPSPAQTEIEREVAKIADRKEAAQMVRELNEHLGNVKRFAPSPAQTRIEVGKPMPPTCTACGSIPVAGYCDIAGCPSRPASPSPAQWPEDLEGFVRNVAHSIPPCDFGSHRAIRAMTEALATLPPPEDERVKGLIEAAREWNEIDNLTSPPCTAEMLRASDRALFAAVRAFGGAKP